MTPSTSYPFQSPATPSKATRSPSPIPIPPSSNNTHRQHPHHSNPSTDAPLSDRRYHHDRLTHYVYSRDYFTSIWIRSITRAEHEAGEHKLPRTLIEDLAMGAFPLGGRREPPTGDDKRAVGREVQIPLRKGKRSGRAECAVESPLDNISAGSALSTEGSDVSVSVGSCSSCAVASSCGSAGSGGRTCYGARLQPLRVMNPGDEGMAPVSGDGENFGNGAVD